MKKRFLPLLLLLCSCATVTSTSTQNIAVATEPAGAACTLKNELGTWHIGKTPGTAAVHRSFSPLHITCTHDAAAPMTATLEGKTRGRAWGNLLLLGIPATVDAGTGYGYEYEPDSVTLSQ
jgi:hypothetical protein